MNKTLKIQVEVPATQVSLFAARKTALMIIDGLDTLDRLGADYNKNAINEFALNLRGAAATYEFDVVINNNFISKEEEVEIMQEITDSLPATHKIIN
jgi:hypothetical protein